MGACIIERGMSSLCVTYNLDMGAKNYLASLEIIWPEGIEMHKLRPGFLWRHSEYPSEYPSSTTHLSSGN